VADAFGQAALIRLRDLKHHHDPDNIFRGNFPILD
jgi:FAD/FMN-containing dehydrogenase